MRGKLLVSLVGEQTIPNVVPLLHYSIEGSVDSSLLVHTSRTAEACNWIDDVLPPALDRLPRLEVSPYDVAATANQLTGRLAEVMRERSLSVEQVMINITGGTKLMSLAAYGLAAQLGCEAIYYQTETAGAPLILSYRFAERQVISSPVVPHDVLTIESYFRAYGVAVPPEASDQRRSLQQKISKQRGDTKRGFEFEYAVYEALSGVVDGVLTGIKINGRDSSSDIDLIFRRGNVVGVGQLKCGKAAYSLDGVKQLTLFSGQPYGTYTKKLLITDDRANPNPADRVQQEHVRAQRIERVRLDSFDPPSGLSERDVCNLRRAVITALGGQYEC